MVSANVDVVEGGDVVKPLAPLGIVRLGRTPEVPAAPTAVLLAAAYGAVEDKDRVDDVVLPRKIVVSDGRVP